MRNLLLLATLTFTAHAQFTLQSSGTDASFRGVYALNGRVAWVSGTKGTVLRTTDGGQHWQHCATPPNASQLDFRGIQAWDKNNAIVMSSGTGNLSRIYKTTDACNSWQLVFTNPDAQGFFDTIQIHVAASSATAPADSAFVVGDPVDGRIATFVSTDRGSHWKRSSFSPMARPGEALFAASNSCFSNMEYITGGTSGARVISYRPISGYHRNTKFNHTSHHELAVELPLTHSESAGAFALSGNIVVGGDYKQPDRRTGTAAYTLDGIHWQAPQTTPHGYRSSVAYDAAHKQWITVGPNGTDISIDDGRNWHPLKPCPKDASNDTPNADKNWNALSLPFVVGPKGRIGKLHTCGHRL